MMTETLPLTEGAYKRIRWTVAQARADSLHVQAWRGKANKPYANYLMSPARFDQWLADEKRAEDRHEVYAAEKKAEAAASLAKQVEQIQVGTIFSNSWGWEQTNVDYYEVVEKKGRKIVLEEIGASSVPGSGAGYNGMADRVVPDPSFRTGKKMVKIIGPYGVSFEYGGGHVWKPGETQYRSWYA